MRANWRLTLASGFGVLLAVTLTAVSVLYSRALAESGIRYAIENNTSGVLLNHELFVQDRPLGEKDYQRLDGVVTSNLDDHLGWLYTDVFRYGQSEQIAFVFNRDDPLPEQDIPVTYLFFREAFQPHSRLIEGRWPQGPFRSDGILHLEAVLGDRAAEFLEWPIGKTIFLVPFTDVQEDKVAITVVGVAGPAIPSESYWFSDLSEFRVGFEAEEEDADFVVPLYVGEPNFFAGMSASYPMLLADYRWYTFLDYESLNASTALRARDSLDSLEADVNQSFPRSLSFTSLGNLVNDYERSLSLARVLLFMFVALVIGVVLYYVILLAIMLARERGAEAAVLRSRGASVWQAGALLGLSEGLVISLPAVLAGPFLGLLLSQFLPMGSLETGSVHVGLSPSVYVASFATAFACIGMFAGVGMGIATQSIVQFLRAHARGLGRSSVYRYAIDFVVLAALGLFWWQISSRGGFVTREFLGTGLNIDLSLLLGPALVLVAASLVLLRVMPWMLQLVARLANPFGVLWLVHGLRRMSRDPLVYGTLSILLMLATALGIFGAMFGTTLSRGQGDEARYEIGGEIVMLPQYVPANIPAAEAVMPIYRGKLATRGPNNAYSAVYSILAVDPAMLPKVAWFREDFANKNLEDLLRPLRTPLPADQGILIPDGAESLSVWVKVDRPFADYDVTLLVKDNEGRYLHMEVGKVGAGTWTRLETALPQEAPWAFPLRLSAILLQGQRFSPYGKGWLAIDNISVVVNGEIVEIEGFESQGPWTLVPNLGTAADTLSLNEDTAYSGEKGALLSWTEPVTSVTRGLFIPPVPMPIPAIGSANFYPGQVLKGGLENRTVQFSVAETVPYFSTLYSNEDPFLIVSLDHLGTYFRAVGLSLPLPLTEVWIGLEEDADRAQTVSDLQAKLPLGRRVVDREAMAQRAEGNPLKGGAWAPMALLGSIAIGSVAILGFSLYAGIAIKRTRLELGVLRAVGFSRRQIGLMLTIEGLIVGALGIGIGLVLGAWLGRWTLGYLSVTSSGRPLVPPLDLSADAWLVALGLTEAVLASLIAILIALMLATKLRLYEVLRVEE